MFMLTLGKSFLSDKALEQIKSYQIDLFSDLGLHFQ